MADIQNYTVQTIVAGTSDSDAIYNYGSLTAIDAGAGADRIFNQAAYVTIEAGAGNDSVYNNNASAAFAYIDVGADKNYVYNLGADSTICGLDGNNTVSNAAQRVNITLGSGIDSVRNSGAYSTVQTGAGSDTVYNSAEHSDIRTGSGNDSVYNYRNEGTFIDVGSGNDTVYNSGDSTTLRAGTGNDIVVNYAAASMSAIDLGDGNDSINSSAAYNSLFGGNGNDSILNFASDTTLVGGAGADYLYNGSDAVNSFLDAANGSDRVVNYGELVTVRTGGGVDSVFNYADNVFVTIDGGSARIYNAASDLTVVGSSNNELISLGGSQSGSITVQIGGGNDTLIANYRAPELIQFTGGALDLANYDYNDTVEIMSGSVAGYDLDGGDLIFNISDGSRITLENMTNHAVTVKDSGGASTKIYSNGYSPLEVIQNFVRSINRSVFTSNRTARLNEAIKACSGFDSMQDVIDQMIADCRAAGSSDKFLKDYCGIILDNDDTGAITGWDAGGLTAKTADNIMPETAPADTLENLTGATYTRNGLTVVYPQNESTLSSDQKKILQNAYRWWIEEATALINETYDFDLAGNTVKLSAVDSSNVSYWGLTSGNAAGNAVSLNLYYTEFDDEDDQDGNGIDRCLAHELTHVMQNIFLNSFPQFLNEGMAELTIGIDDMRTVRIASVASSADSLATYLDLNTGGTGNANYYAAGYMFWRYLAKQASDSFDSLKTYAWSEDATLNGTSDGELLTASGRGLTVVAGAGDDTVNAYGDSEAILGGDGDDRIVNLGSNSTVLGGAGADSIYNGASDVTIDSGAGDDYIDAYSSGADMIIYSKDGGNDLIANFYGDDTLMITAGEIASQGSVGSDYIVTVEGEGVITLKGAASRVTADNIVVEVESSAIVNTLDGVKVSGTSNADSIVTDGARVTIQGNGGDDTITGSDNGELILVASNHGNDVVTNFGVNDTLKCTAGKIATVTTVGDDAVVSLKGAAYSGTVTLQGAGGYQFKRTNTYLTVIPINTIVNSANGVKVVGTSDADSIVNSGSGVTIQGNAGDDTIVGSDNGEMILVASNHGNDVVMNFGTNDTIKCTAGKIATVTTVGDDAVVSLKGAAYSGTVTLVGAGGYRFDYSSSILKVNAVNAIVNTLDGVKVVGTSDADSIVNSGSGVTIQGNAGDDTITGSDNGEMILVASNHGNDVITNFGENDTLKCTAGKIATVQTVGDDAVVSLKGAAYSATVTLLGAGGYRFDYSSSILKVNAVNAIVNTLDGVKVVGTSDADSIVTGGARVTIQGNGGDDTITGSDNGEMILVASNHGNDVVMNFGTNDTLKCTAGKIATVQTVGDDAVVSLKGAAYSGSVTLLGVADYRFDYSSSLLTVDPINTIVNTLDGVKVVGTSDADSIVTGGARVTIQGNGGDDTITGSDNGEMILVASNHGNDVVTNFGENDTLKCTAGKIATVTTVGDDAIVSLKGAAYSATVTLAGAADYRFDYSSSILRVDDSASNVADYWFTAEEPLVEDNALEPIVQSDDVFVALDETPLIDRLNNPIAPSIVGLTQSPRHRLKK